ncbi:MAG: threonine/serine exporter family protein [Tannerellaceae bacterium]|nr:threonine/serine exporter family protein [Tannerellaceae bacterium]
MIIWKIIQDALFAAIAGMGFGAISNPPLKAFPYIALLAATGHSFRYTLMEYVGIDIALASLAASLLIGFGSLWLGGKSKYPITVPAIPALLPMVPGKLAYNTVFSIIMFLQTINVPEEHGKYLYMLMDNGFLSLTIIFFLALGVAVPIAIFPKKAYSLTRRRF